MQLSKIKQQLFSKNFLKRNWHLLLTILLVIAFGLWIHFKYRNTINPDGVSYFQITKHYANFDIKRAINGYWSPLLSWLMIPFAWLKIDLQAAFHIINFSAALAVISGLLISTSKIIKQPKLAQKLFILTSVAIIGVIMMTWGASPVTPDLLSAACLVVALLAVQKFLEKASYKTAVFLGLSLAIFYFSKSVGFYVAVFILAAIFAWFFIKKQLVGNFKPLLLTGLVFLLVTLPWIAAISLKYHKITISTAGDYTMSLIGPDSPGHPHVKPGILPVVREGDVWTWDDPSYFDMPKWSKKQHFEYFIKYFFTNLSNNTKLFISFSPIVAICIALLLYFINPARVLILVAGGLLIIAHSVFFIEDRYNWAAALPIMVFGIIIACQKLSKQKLWVITTFSLVITLLLNYHIYTASPFFVDTQRELAELSKSVVKPGSLIAGDGHNFAYCYYTQTSCIGSMVLDNKTSQTLLDNKIDYFVDYNPPREITGMQLVFQNSFRDNKNSYCKNSLPDCPVHHLSIYKVIPQ